MSAPRWENTRYPPVKKYESVRGETRYLVRYRRADGRQSTKQGFKTTTAARVWLSEQEDAERKGTAVEIAAGRVTVGELWPKVLAMKELTNSPAALGSLRSSWRMHVEPRWGAVQVSKVRTGDVQDWAASIKPAKRNNGQRASASVILRAVGVLSDIMKVAVRDGRISRNPAEAKLLTLPTKPRHGKVGEARRYLTAAEVQKLAETVDSDRAAVVWLAAVVGLRFSEINGLQAGDVDLDKRRIKVVRAWTQDETGKWHLGDPKHHKRRTVPVPDFLVPVLKAQLEGKAEADRLILRRDGSDRPLPYPGKAKGWNEATWLERGLESAGIARLTVHDLRHTAASLAVQAGANVKALSRMLGHADASMTLNVYADLFDSDLDDVATRLDWVFSVRA